MLGASIYNFYPSFITEHMLQRVGIEITHGEKNWEREIKGETTQKAKAYAKG